MVAVGANAEFGRTAGGVINVVTKSGTNQTRGSLFHYQRLEGLTSNTSDGKPLKDFHREQSGGTIGGPLVKDRTFFFLAFEGIRENLQRPNLSEPIGGTACPVSAPTIGANEALINGNADCQRLALLSLLPLVAQAGGGASGRPQDQQQLAARKARLEPGEEPQPLGVLQLQLLEEHQPDLRRGHLRQLGQRHRGAVEDQRAERQPVQHARRQPGERAALQLLEREPASLRRHVVGACRHGHRVRAVVPVRQPVLPGAERRRDDQALPVQGQHDAGSAGATRSRPAASGCTRTTTRSSAASSRAGTCSTASPGSCGTRRRPRPAATGRTPSGAATART